MICAFIAVISMVERGILVKQVLDLRGATLPKPCEGGMIRDVFLLQQPHEIHPEPAGFLLAAAGVDPALVTVGHYLEHHPRIGCRFPPLGRIGAIQVPVVQFLKLGACQPDGCVLR